MTEPKTVDPDEMRFTVKIAETLSSGWHWAIYYGTDPRNAAQTGYANTETLARTAAETAAQILSNMYRDVSNLKPEYSYVV